MDSREDSFRLFPFTPFFGTFFSIQANIIRGGSWQKNPGRIRDGYPSRIRPGNLFWAGTGTDIYARRIGMYVAYPLHTYGALCNKATSHLYTWESVQTNIVPVPAVPVPTSPEGVIPEVPVPGGFFCRDPPLNIIIRILEAEQPGRQSEGNFNRGFSTKTYPAVPEHNPSLRVYHLVLFPDPISTVSGLILNSYPTIRV